MDKFPEDFTPKKIPDNYVAYEKDERHPKKSRIIVIPGQEDLMCTAREAIYNKFLDGIKNELHEVEFSFSTNLTKESKDTLLFELLEKFPTQLFTEYRYAEKMSETWVSLKVVNDYNNKKTIKTVYGDDYLNEFCIRLANNFSKKYRLW